MKTMIEAESTGESETSIEKMVEGVLARIPPLWPLKHFVAVNPFTGLTGMPFAEACGLLKRNAGASLLQGREDYLAAYRAGDIRRDDLEAVADEKMTAAELVAALESGAETGGEQVLTVADWLDSKRAHAHWSVFVVEEISKWCGVALDENQTTWNSPWKGMGLYAGWRAAAVHDHNPEAFGLHGFSRFVRALPENAGECVARCLELIAPQGVALEDFLHRELMTISGWAGYVQYLVREDVMRGKANGALHDLLAIRLAYDAALYAAKVASKDFEKEWQGRVYAKADGRILEALTRWQGAYEFGYQANLGKMLARAVDPQVSQRARVQAVFCIDVRSEIFRRHLEAMPGMQTIGFAGFFGFPLSHRPAGAAEGATRCPVLLVPPVATEEPLSAREAGDFRMYRAEKGAWKAFQNSAASCFSFVETAGLAFGAVLGRLNRAKGECCEAPEPGYVSTDLEGRIGLAEGALRNMSLTKGFARLVLICGHGSHSMNNPHASSLDCGACGGHAGDVNARLAAATLNEEAVRVGLADRGIQIPADTFFLAGLHDTLTDKVALYEQERIPASHAAEAEELKLALAKTGSATRNERAAMLGLGGLAGEKLDRAVRARGDDISQVRPEWGLANNAALVAAPRYRSAGLNLSGRVFLHDYEAGDDPELQVLTLILCAPVVVASWINLQYYASRMDPAIYGSGDKALHNVVGGIGVMEGNGGDLRPGLPLQSIHDGEKFVHEPRRLTVYLEAERENIDRVLDEQTGVRELFDNGWIHLVALEGGVAYRRRGGWERLG